MFIAVSLSAPRRDMAAHLSHAVERAPSEWLTALRGGWQRRDPRAIAVRELERMRVDADEAHARLLDFVDARPARAPELQWLVRRAFCRSLGEPVIDGLHEPQALIFERNGEATLSPLEADVMRWTNSFIEHRSRCLVVESELGTSWQAQLVAGALPSAPSFPDHVWS